MDLIDAIRRLNVPPGPKATLMAIVQHVDSYDRFPSVKLLAQRNGVTPRSVQRHLRWLRSQGFVDVQDERIRRVAVRQIQGSLFPRAQVGGSNGGVGFPQPDCGEAEENPVAGRHVVGATSANVAGATGLAPFPPTPPLSPDHDHPSGQLPSFLTERRTVTARARAASRQPVENRGAATFRRLCQVAAAILRLKPAIESVDLREDLKTAAARLRLPYSADLIYRVENAARVAMQRRRTG